VAGGTDALSGTLAFHADQPVISCAPDGMNPSCLNNPPGSSNATIIRPKNVARFIAQIFALEDPVFRRRIRSSRIEKIRYLEQKDIEFKSSL